MKTFPAAVCLALASGAMFGGAATADVIRLSEPVAVTETAEIYGAPLDEDSTPVPLAGLLERPSEYLDRTVRVEARIAEVCRKKGCFMIATAGGLAIRISFRDYRFFVPTDTGGKTVTLTGTLVERTLTEDEAAHFREDANSDAIVSGKVYELVADAVSVPKA